MKLEELISKKLSGLKLASGANLIELLFDDNIVLEIYAIPEDGSLKIDILEYELKRSLKKKTKITE